MKQLFSTVQNTAASAVLGLLFCSPSFASSTEAARIRVFETSLLPAISVDGEPDRRWTVQERMAHWKVPGLSVAVIRDGKLAWAKGYGVRQAGQPEAVDTNTVFSTASLSKVPTAAITLRLVEAGKLDLDRDVNGYLTRWRIPANPYTQVRPVTLRGILSHSAGLTLSGFPDFQPESPLPTVIETLQGRAPAVTEPVRVANVPGERYSYSGGGTTVEQLIIEEASGLDFTSAARQYLFSPLRMARSTFENPLPAAHGNIAKAHGDDGQARALPRGYESMPEMAASGLWTTPSDYARLIVALIESYRGNEGAFIGTALARQMMTEVGRSPVGLGPFLEGEASERRFYHSGTNDSYRSWMEGHLATGDGMVVFTNGSNGGQLYQEVRRAIARAEGWAPALSYRVQAPAIKLSPRELEETVGVYVVQSPSSTPASRSQRDEVSYSIVHRDGQIFFVSGGSERRLTPIGALQFVMEVGEAGTSSIEFVRDYSGAIAGLIQRRSKDRFIEARKIATASGRDGAASAEADAKPASQRPLRLAIGFFQHEATTFSPETAGLDDFPQPNLQGQALLDLADEPIEGFVQFTREHQGIELVPLESQGGQIIGGSSKGWITREAFEHYAKLMIDSLRASLPVDAVYLSLHGAAAVEGIARPEAELTKRVRAIVGSKVPIAATFDPHGNEDEEFLRHANFSLVMKYFPHYDGRLQGERAARLLIRTARGDYRPTTSTRKPAIITPTVVQWTGQYPWSNVVQRALTWEASQRDAYVSVFFGFPWSDVPDVGATVQVMTNGNQALADEIAEDMAGYMWRLREDLAGAESIVAPAAAVTQAQEATRQGRTPIVLADYSDRTGDATHILSEIVRQDLGGVLYTTLRDERLIAALKTEGAKAGDVFDRDVGGFVTSPDSGKPVRIRGKLVYFGQPPSRSWTTAVIEFGRGNWLVITPKLVQITEPEQLRWLPADPERFTSWVLKSRAHFRRGFDDTGYAKTILIVDAPGPFLGTVHLDQLPYRHAPLRQLYPYREQDTRGTQPR